MEDPSSSRSRRGTLAGEIVAGHELLRVVAIGGMGEVYLARHLALGMNRAIKVLRTDLRSRDNSLDRFEREAQVLARLQHNSIVQIVDYGELPNGWPFLAMEYIDGPSLDDLVDAGPLALAAAVIVLEQLAIALRYAHSHGVIHRDLKPSNVLVRSRDIRQVKIIDFGLARLIGADKRLTADGQMIGSPAYMAPEQVEGEREVTEAVDVYALAGIAYTLLSGRPPFDFPSSIRLMAAQVQDPPPRLGERCTIPPFIDSLLLACLEKSPAHRPRTDELVDHFARLTRGSALADASVAHFDPARHEVVAAPWNAADRRTITISSRLLDVQLPPAAEGQAAQVMGMIVEIASRLSNSDRELTALLGLETKIREQLTEVERELAALNAHAGETPLAKHRDALAERARTLKTQQLPLQRRIVEVVERHRRVATGAIKSLFDEIDRALDQLDGLR